MMGLAGSAAGNVVLHCLRGLFLTHTVPRGCCCCLRPGGRVEVSHWSQRLPPKRSRTVTPYCTVLWGNVAFASIDSRAAFLPPGHAPVLCRTPLLHCMATGSLTCDSLTLLGIL